MPIEVDIKRKFVVNGREYGSIEEVPEEVREAIQKTMSSGKNIEVNTEKSITLNGKTYKSTSEMSPNDRKLYEEALKAAAGNISPTEIADLGMALNGSQNPSKSPGLSLSFSLTPLFVILIALLAAIALYFYFS